MINLVSITLFLLVVAANQATATLNNFLRETLQVPIGSVLLEAQNNPNEQHIDGDLLVNNFPIEAWHYGAPLPIKSREKRPVIDTGFRKQHDQLLLNDDYFNDDEEDFTEIYSPDDDKNNYYFHRRQKPAASDQLIHHVDKPVTIAAAPPLLLNIPPQMKHADVIIPQPVFTFAHQMLGPSPVLQQNQTITVVADTDNPTNTKKIADDDADVTTKKPDVDQSLNYFEDVIPQDEVPLFKTEFVAQQSTMPPIAVATGAVKLPDFYWRQIFELLSHQQNHQQPRRMMKHVTLAPIAASNNFYSDNKRPSEQIAGPILPKPILAAPSALGIVNADGTINLVPIPSPFGNKHGVDADYLNSVPELPHAKPLQDMSPLSGNSGDNKSKQLLLVSCEEVQYLISQEETGQLACCGKKLYNNTEMVCLNGRIVNKTTPSARFSSRIQHQQKSSTNVPTCGRFQVSYNPNVLFCCGENLYHKLAGQICCENEIYAFSVDETLGCCSSTPYNIKTDVCKTGNFVASKNSAV